MGVRQGRLVLAVSLPVLVAVMALGGCQLTDWKQAREYRGAFREAAPQPEWWGDVSVEGVEIGDYPAMLACWQGNDRTDRQFFKAGYQAILDHPLDEDLVVNTINLLPAGYRDYPFKMTMLEFAIDRHFDYDRPLEGYGGKPGDAIAGIVRDLSETYNTMGAWTETIELVERLIDEREFEINDHMLELITIKYAEALYENGLDHQAVTVLESAIDKYDGDWEQRLGEKLSLYRGPQ